MAELNVPRLDFSILGNLGKDYKDAQRSAARERTLAELGQGSGPLDYDAAARKLLSVGDREGALSLAQLGNNQRDFAFRQQEAQRSQGNADRSFRLQERTATEKPQYMKNDAGEIIEVTPGRGARIVTPEGAPSSPVNPYAAPGGQTEGQANASLYASRLFNAEKVLRDPAVEAAAQSTTQRLAGMLPGAGKLYNPNSAEYQKFDQARRDFVNAVLRRESGAVISDAEFANAEKQYFPVPGDSKVVIEQKRRNRADAIKGIAGAGGKNYRPESVFDASGNIVPNASPVRGTPAAPQSGGITKDQYDALPPGTPYTAPDGSQRVKK